MQEFATKLGATRNLVSAGIGMVTRMQHRQDRMEAAVESLAKSIRAYIDSPRGGNGNGRH
jgi:hypothetical protein